ncbi:putative Mannose-1-phosphate guanylyltransferase [Blattamonas nauphoetae]|uniref:Mannose-1-phosphate guanylyltransferase n=1 Tax=Blattamonas nauphoetae TaxID=2049346 RepID=A0ABQ9YLM8_9EUKA|nr:putative Mannose-1-phosphate guanylyltransferase [Blattamonas nauphoetae]
MITQWWACMMAGGASSRFFPMNKILFDPAHTGRTLAQQAFDRLCAKTTDSTVEELDPHRFLIVTAKSFAPILSEHIPELPKDNFLCEPAARSTLPAILLAMCRVRQSNPDDILCVVTADHIISNIHAFRSTMETAREIASVKEAIVTIGITPTNNPADWTPFGAINSDTSTKIPLSKHTHPECIGYPLICFEEKPNVQRAQEMVDANKQAASSPLSHPSWTWNAGMFVFRVSTMEKALEAFHPEFFSIYQQLCSAPNEEERNKVFLTFPPKVAHPLNPAQTVDSSVDYVVMMPLTEQNHPTLVGAVIPGNFPWFDVGGWGAFKKVESIQKDEHKNVKYGNVQFIQSKGCVASTLASLTITGMTDLIAIHSDEGILALIPDAISARLKDLKQKVDETKEGNVLVECSSVDINNAHPSSVRVCALGIKDMSIVVEEKDGKLSIALSPRAKEDL